MVSMTTRTSGCSRVIRRVASMPSSSPGIWMSITHDVGLLGGDHEEGLGRVGGLADRPGCLPCREQRDQPVPHDGVVVDDHDADLVRLAHGAPPSPVPSGSTARTTVPPEDGQLTSVRPPSSAARSRDRQQADPGLHVLGDADPVVGDLDHELRSRCGRGGRVRSWPRRAGRRWSATRRRSGRPPPPRRRTGCRDRRRPPRSAAAGSRPAGAPPRRAPGRRAPAAAGRARAGVRRRRCPAPVRSPGSSWSPRPRAGPVVDEQARGLELVDDAGHRRAETVVQVAADPAALLLAGDHQPLPAGLELVGELAGARGGRRLPDQVAEQLLVAARTAGCAARAPEARAGRPRCRGR